MEIYVQKIAMIRPETNPKNTDLNLGIDWSVEYKNTDQSRIDFDMILKSCENFDLNFKIEGIVELDLFEYFIQDEISQIIFNRACNILMNMISITRESSHMLSDSNDLSSLGSEHIPNTLFN